MNRRLCLLRVFLGYCLLSTISSDAMEKPVRAIVGIISAQEEDKRLLEMVKKLFDKNLAREFTCFCEKKPPPNSSAEASYILACWCHDHLGRIRDIGVVQQLFYDALSTGELSPLQKAMAQYKLAFLLAKKHDPELDKQVRILLQSIDCKELGEFAMFVQYKLARWFAKGRGGGRDEGLARKYFQLAIDSHMLGICNLANAAHYLGILYADGSDKKCGEEADERFFTAIKSEIQVKLAYLGGNAEKIFGGANHAGLSSKSLANTQFRLGMLYCKPNDCDYRQARALLLPAVRSGQLDSASSAHAECALAEMCFNGHGGERDDALARELFSSAIGRQEIIAERKARAQYFLAWLCADGRGGPADNERARTLFEESLASGKLWEVPGDYAKYRLALLLLREGGAQNDTRARGLLNAAFSGVIGTSYGFDMLYQLAVLLHDGRGGPHDEWSAITLLRDMVNRGKAKDQLFKDDCLRKDVQQRLQKLCDTVRQFPIDSSLLSGRLSSLTRFLGNDDVLPDEKQVDELLKIVSAEIGVPQDGLAAILYRLATCYLGNKQKSYGTQCVPKLLEAAILSWQTRSLLGVGNLKSRFQLADAQYKLACWYQNGPFKNCLRERELFDGIDCNCLSLYEEADVYRRLGILYAKGEGGMQNNVKAQTLFEKAMACKVLDGGSCGEISSWVTRLNLDLSEWDLWDWTNTVDLDPVLQAYMQYRLGIFYALGGRWQEWYDRRRKEIADFVGGPPWEETMNERAQTLLQRALESGHLEQAQTKSAEYYLALCRDFKEQELLEQKVVDTQTTPNELALAQLKLATLYAHIKNGVYHDRRARELLNAALKSEKLSRENAGLACYEYARLCDEQMGGSEVGDEACDDGQAREFFCRVIALGISNSAKLADAQYRLARLLVLGVGGDANLEEAQNLLGSAINSGNLMSRRLAMAQTILGAVRLRIGREKKRVQDAECFSRQLAAEEALIREPLAALQKRINSEQLRPAQLADLQFQAAFLRYQDPSSLGWEEGEKVKRMLKAVRDSGFLSRVRVALINHMLGEQGEEPDTWQLTEQSIINDRADSGEDAILDYECERKIYEAVMEEDDSAFVRYKLACLYDEGRGGARDKKRAIELLEAVIKGGNLNSTLVPDVRSRLDRLRKG